MKKFLKFLKLWTTYGPEVEILLDKERLKLSEEQEQKQRLILSLCAYHKGTDSAVPTNHCDYCTLAGYAQQAIFEVETRTKCDAFRGYKIPKLLNIPRSRNAQ